MGSLQSTGVAGALKNYNFLGEFQGKFCRDLGISRLGRFLKG